MKLQFLDVSWLLGSGSEYKRQAAHLTVPKFQTNWEPTVAKELFLQIYVVRMSTNTFQVINQLWLLGSQMKLSLHVSEHVPG